MAQLLGIVPPDTVEINGRTVKYDVYKEACEYAQNDKRIADLLAKLVVEYIDKIESYYRKQEERIRKEVEEFVAASYSDATDFYITNKE